MALFVGLAQPASPRVALDWQAPEGCPDAAAVGQSVETLSGVQVVASADEAALRAEAAVSRTEAGFALALTLRTNGTTQVRALEATDCAVIARAAALVVTVALDPVEVATRMPEPEPEPELEPEPAPAPAPAPDLEPEPEPEPKAEPDPEPALVRRRRPLELGVGASVGVAGRA
ncbi:MAG: hypothetical protein AAGA54_29095, partial [Myxococcota bacterium]